MSQDSWLQRDRNPTHILSQKSHPEPMSHSYLGCPSAAPSQVAWAPTAPQASSSSACPKHSDPEAAGNTQQWRMSQTSLIRLRRVRHVRSIGHGQGSPRSCFPPPQHLASPHHVIGGQGSPHIPPLLQLDARPRFCISAASGPFPNWDSQGCACTLRLPSEQPLV